MKLLSVAEYADLRGVTRQSVLLAIKRAADKGETAQLPFVDQFKKVGRAYVLQVDVKKLKRNLVVSN